MPDSTMTGSGCVAGADDTGGFGATGADTGFSFADVSVASTDGDVVGVSGAGISTAPSGVTSNVFPHFGHFWEIGLPLSKTDSFASHLGH